MGEGLIPDKLLLQQKLIQVSTNQLDKGLFSLSYFHLNNRHHWVKVGPMRQERHKEDLCTQRQVQTKRKHQDILQRKQKKKTQNNWLKCPFPGTAPSEGSKGLKMTKTSVVWDCCALPSRPPEVKDFPLKWVCRKKNTKKHPSVRSA